MRWWPVLLIATAASAAPRTAKPVPPAKLVGNLDSFAAALAAQRAGTATHPLRISWFGDSVTADDHITNVVREKLQALLGDGGPGFVFAAPPHPYCANLAVTRVLSGAWTIHGVSTTGAADRLLGLGGDAESEGEGTIRFVPHAGVRSIDVHYLAQPHGGTFEVVADGASLAKIETAGEKKAAQFARVALPEGTKRIELRAKGRVRLFGVTLEAPSGAVVDNLGIVNATAKQMRNNILDDHLENQLVHRASDLVIVMLGTNEAEWLHAKTAGMAEHEKLFGELLATIRRAHVSCLVVSPLDQIDWRDDKMPARTSVPAMVDAQRRAAVANGCAFWDVYRWMGGKGSSKAWYDRGLVAKDFQHPTSAGAEMLAAALHAGLTAATN
jgi:lysophospholipase L1-like esterase